MPSGQCAPASPNQRRPLPLAEPSGFCNVMTSEVCDAPIIMLIRASLSLTEDATASKLALTSSATAASPAPQMYSESSAHPSTQSGSVNTVAATTARQRPAIEASALSVLFIVLLLLIKGFCISSLPGHFVPVSVVPRQRWRRRWWWRWRRRHTDVVVVATCELADRRKTSASRTTSGFFFTFSLLSGRAFWLRFQKQQDR